MAVVSALARGSARVWWAVAYWTPRAPEFRRRTRALELGVEWQRARECPADDEWRQQVEQAIATSAVVVPMTADLLVAAVERGVPVSRRWRPRHQRAIARMRIPQSSELRPASKAVAGRRRALARVVPVVAALALGTVVGPTVQHAVTHGHPAIVQHPLDGETYVTETINSTRVRIPVFSDVQLGTQPGWVPTSVLVAAQRRAAARKNSATR